jgi:Pregnancy-associated plasma protein-A
MTNHGINVCGTDRYHKWNLATRGERYRKNRDEDEKYVLKYMGSSARRAARADIVTIPVVVHVVYNREEDIPDDQIHSQIAVLNKDFRKLNEDINKVPPPFRSMTADTRIEFKLACRDPLGDRTSGITRTRTEIASFDIPDDGSNPEAERIKYAIHGGHDAWDSTRFLNIWVCDLAGGLLGYAQFPAGPPETDGVVINHWAFGDKGTVMSTQSPFGMQFNKGRTTTHEIGHYLDLYHIWGDDQFLADPCGGTDNVADTPNTTGSNAGKPSFPNRPNACPDTGPEGDMFMNFMDYTDDDSMYMFTNGQAVRMRAALNGSRRSLVDSDVLICFADELEVSHGTQLPSRVYDGVGKMVDITEKL